ncbi:extracellular solute-binding protein, partial [Klebsiella pneumoniae]|nr:extracellular solute-binding protein [Klebsiella pneumoniae]
FFNDLIKKFEKEHSGCTIKWTDLPGTDDFDTTMVTQASNGTMADVVNMSSSTIMALSRADYLLDIETSVPGIGDKFVP